MAQQAYFSESLESGKKGDFSQSGMWAVLGV